MKEVLFIILLLILGACANVNETGKKETSKSDTVITEDKKLKFVRNRLSKRILYSCRERN